MHFRVISASSLEDKASLTSVQLREFSIPILGYELYSLLFSLLAILTIINVHSKRRIGILYAVETGYAGLATTIAGKLLRLPVIVHAHCRRSEQLRRERYSYGGWSAWPYWAIEKSIDHFVLTKATKVVVVSRDVEDFVRKLGYRKSILIARSGIRLEDYRGGYPKWRRILRIPHSSFVVGYYGRLHYTKGVHILITAYSEFSKLSSESTFLLIGGIGPASKSLESLVQKLNIENVRFLGYLPEVKSFLRSLTVFVFPSFQEGSPFALLEAMAVGCPTIASDIPGITQMANGSAMLFPSGSVKGLVDALNRLRKDTSLRTELSRLAKAESSKYSLDEILKQIFDFCLN